jgi:hypothetical protein
MTAITPFLDTVTALTEGGSDFLGNAKIFTLNPHSIKPYRMPALLKLFKLLRMALPAFFRENHGLLIRSSLVVNVAGDAIDSVLRMFRFDPGLKEARCSFLVAGDAEPHIYLFHFFGGSGAHRE